MIDDRLLPLPAAEALGSGKHHICKLSIEVRLIPEQARVAEQGRPLARARKGDPFAHEVS